MQYTIDDIKRANENAGKYFFSPGAMRFFKSRIGQTVYQGQGGIYFVTSERFDWQSPRKYTVRRFNPGDGSIDTINEFNHMSRSGAVAAAHRLAQGGTEQC